MGLLTFTKNTLFRNERGVSLVEGMVGLGAIAGLAAIIANISSNTNNRGMIYRRACESMAVNAIDAITDEGIFMNVYDFTPSSSKINITTAEGAGLFTIDEIADGDLWPAASNMIDPVASGADLPPVLRNEKLIQGAMRALNALYNNQANTDYCAGFASYPEMTFGNLGIENELTRSDPANPPTIDLRLQAVVWNDNSVVCPPKPFYIAPVPGLVNGRRAWHGTSYNSLVNGLGAPTDVGNDWSPDGITRNDTEYGLFYKWRLSARVNYTYRGENFDCIIGRDFEYPEDATAPDVGTVNMAVVENSTRDTDYMNNNCATPVGAVADIGIEIDINGLEGGSMLFCRDISEEFVYNSPALQAANDEANASPMCYEGNNSNVGTYDRVDPREDLNQPSYQDFVTATTAEDKWYPCHAARICGGVGGAVENSGVAATPALGPDSAVVSASELTQGNRTISLAYSDVPVDCIIGLQVIAVDIAGNTSGQVADYLSIVPDDGEIMTFRGLVDSGGALNPHYSATDTEVDASIAGVNRQGTHRAWCGDRNGETDATFGTPGTNTWGQITPHGVWCEPPTNAENISDMGTTGGPKTPNWANSGLPISAYRPHGDSSNTAANPTAGLNRGADTNEDWRDDFPNGYYTCRPGGCCFSTDSSCTPWSN